MVWSDDAVPCSGHHGSRSAMPVERGKTQKKSEEAAGWGKGKEGAADVMETIQQYHRNGAVQQQCSVAC